jgi:hypothetical protein
VAAVTPPPSLPDWLVDLVSRWESLAGIAVQTGFGGLVGGLALAAALDEGAIRAAVVVAAIVSGGAAILATYGLMFGCESHPPPVVITRKWLGSIVSLALLFTATAVGLVAATLFLF